jgi:mono/diheme cytochrome c family protein
VRRNQLIFWLVLLLFSGAASCSSGKDWGMPPSAKNLKNPVTPNSENLAAAKAIYEDRCARCHGDRGAGDGPDASLYKPLPSRLDDDKTRQMTEGELFWKISKGRRPMPGYSNELTEEQRWQLVNLLRTFSANAPPEAAPESKESAVPNR